MVIVAPLENTSRMMSPRVAPSAWRTPNSLRALPHCLRHHAVDTDDREEQRRQTEGRNQPQREAACRDRRTGHGVERPDVRQRQLRIDLAQRVTDRIDD